MNVSGPRATNFPSSFLKEREREREREREKEREEEKKTRGFIFQTGGPTVDGGLTK